VDDTHDRHLVDKGTFRFTCPSLCNHLIALGPASVLSFGTASSSSSRGAGRVTRDGAQSGDGVRTTDSRVRFSGAAK